VNPNPLTRGELEEHLLSDSPRLDHDLTVNFGSTSRESPLRRTRLHGVTDEIARELSCNAVNGMTLRH
jgi:hypothetical protein